MIICGVYKITNLIVDKETGIHKVYIGSSNNLRVRKNTHFRELKNNEHSNSYLQNAYNKVKKESDKKDIEFYFKWEVVKDIKKYKDITKLKKELLKWEQLYLDEYISEHKVDPSRCYNILPTAVSNAGNKGSMLGKKHNELTKKKMSLSAKGRVPPNKGKPMSKEQRVKIGLKSIGRGNKKIVNTTTGVKFNSIKEAGEFYNICQSSIGEACKGKRKTAGSFRWEYSEEKLNRASKEVLLYRSTNDVNKKKKKVLNLTTKREFSSLTEAGKFYGICGNSIGMVCSGKAISAGGFLWEYIDK